MGLLRRAFVLLTIAGAVGCGGSHGDGRRAAPERPGPRPVASCPARLVAPNPLPGVLAKHRAVAYWLGRAALQGNLDEILLSPAQIAAHNHALAVPRWDGKALAWLDLLSPVDPVALHRELNERLGYIRDRVARGEYVDFRGGQLEPAELAKFALPDPLPELQPQLHVALAHLPFRCGPRRDGLYKAPVDPTFNRNNCGAARSQEPILVLSRWPGGLSLARSRYSLGWIDDDAALSPPVPGPLKAAIASGPRSTLMMASSIESDDRATAQLEAATLLPPVPNRQGRIYFATALGIHESQELPPARLRPTERPLTRRLAIEAAFEMLDAPYGWGGEAGGRDCSGFVLDLFASFGLQLPRDSGRQALAGTDSMEIAPGRSEQDRLALIDEAAGRGIVLLHFPGHIMLYLGRTEAGTPMAIHSFAEYLEPCEGGGETLRKVDRVTVSDLSLGRGTSRTSFIERLTRVVVLGWPPDSW